jgi:predicted PurR-regulated permease PerM
MSLFDRRTARVLFTILVVAAVLGSVWLARKPIIVFIFAMLFAYLLEPLIQWVQPSVRNSRALAILVVFVMGAIVLFALGLLIGPKIVDEGRKLAHAAPSLYEKISSGDIAWQFGSRRGWSEETMRTLQGFLASHKEAVLEFVNTNGQRAAQLAGNLGWVVLVPILAIFFLKDKSRFSQGVQELLNDRRERTLLRNVLSEMDEMVAHYVRAQLYLAMISGAVYTVMLALLLRVPYGFVLGTIGGFLEFIPVVGPLVTAVIILGVAFTSNYQHLLLVLLFLGAWRGIQDYVIAPRVLGTRIELHPLATVFGILVGGEIGGVVGVYLAVPVMAAVRILWRLVGRYQRASVAQVRDREAA